MNQIQIIVGEYMDLCKQYDFLSIGNPLPMGWEETLTASVVAEMRQAIEFLNDISKLFINKLDELEEALQPYGYHENTVYTIGQYMLQGFTAQEAPKARKHDIIWNKWLNGKATPKEIEKMEAIIKELGL